MIDGKDSLTIKNDNNENNNKTSQNMTTNNDNNRECQIFPVAYGNSTWLLGKVVICNEM